MFGWINDCTECLVISKFGEETWHQIKEKANCTVVDGGFLRYKYYPDSDTVELVVAASEVLGISVDDVLHAFGDYFIDYVQDNGYSNVLECLGSNLRDWLSNLNSLHDHLQASYPKGFVAPVFWSEDDLSSNDEDHAILVYYYSQRGSLLVPLVVGLLKKLARVYFSIEINLEQLTLQDDENGVPHTSWRVTSADPTESYRLRGKKKKKKNKGPHSNADDGTITTTATTATSMSRYERTFREGGTQASNLRVEEFVKRSFFNQNCGLYHALTMEQYVYLAYYWKITKTIPSTMTNAGEGGKRWCYEIWTMQEDDPDSWPTLQDLPPNLHPATIDTCHFGGKVPATGAYPPNEQGVLQSFPPKIRIMNSITQKSVDIVVPPEDNSKSIDTAIYNAKDALESRVAEFCKDSEVATLVKNKQLEVQWVIWNDETDDTYHTFTLRDLASTSTQQLYDLVTGTKFDPIKLVITLKESDAVDDDEEDI